MGAVILINSIFTLLMICPLYYTGAGVMFNGKCFIIKTFISVAKINDRHNFIQRLIGSKEDENVSFENGNEVVMVVSICCLVFTALETLFYFLFNIRVSFAFHFIFCSNLCIYLVPSLAKYFARRMNQK